VVNKKHLSRKITDIIVTSAKNMNDNFPSLVGAGSEVQGYDFSSFSF
jgi:hypothetical protein